MRSKIIIAISILYMAIAIYMLLAWIAVTVAWILHYQEIDLSHAFMSFVIGYIKDFAVSAGMLIGSIGLLRKKDWARKLLIVVFTIVIYGAIHVMAFLHGILPLSLFIALFFIASIIFLLFLPKFPEKNPTR